MESQFSSINTAQPIGSNSHAFSLSQHSTITQGRPNYAIAANKDIQKIDNTYTNARFAQQGSDKVGKPFPMYKEYGGRMTQWTPTSLSVSTLKKNMNLPTDTTALRTGLTKDAIGLGDDSLTNWVYTSQTLGNASFSSAFCTSDTDCSAFGTGYKCNSNYEPFPDSHGSQSGSTCVQVVYPELASGKYNRKLANQGGIGRGCSTNNDCGTGYECNNETDMFGKNVQQTGYCAQTYACSDEKKRYLGTPVNSGIPHVPSSAQNNNGSGYRTKEECVSNASAHQDCVLQGQAYYAVFPGFCPTKTTLRKESHGQGALRSTDSLKAASGFIIPSYATSGSSSGGGASHFSALASKKDSGLNGPLQYSLNINPRVPNQ